MGSPARGTLRAVRTAALAVVVLALAGAAHAAGGAPLPRWPALALLALPVAAVCALATRWRLSAGALVLALGGAQLVLHHALTALAGPAAAATGHAQHAALERGAAQHAALDHAALDHAGSGGGALLMPAAHVVATVVLALLLARGEAALWDLLAWLSPLAVPAARARLLPSTRSPLPAVRARVVPASSQPLAVAPHRGPPAGLVLAV